MLRNSVTHVHFYKSEFQRRGLYFRPFSDGPFAKRFAV